MNCVTFFCLASMRAGNSFWACMQIPICMYYGRRPCVLHRIAANYYGRRPQTLFNVNSVSRFVFTCIYLCAWTTVADHVWFTGTLSIITVADHARFVIYSRNRIRVVVGAHVASHVFSFFYFFCGAQAMCTDFWKFEVRSPIIRLSRTFHHCWCMVWKLLPLQ